MLYNSNSGKMEVGLFSGKIGEKHSKRTSAVLNHIMTKTRIFSIVAFKTLDISQGSVATHLRCGGIFSDSIITNFFSDSDSEIISKTGQYLMK